MPHGFNLDFIRTTAHKIFPHISQQIFRQMPGTVTGMERAHVKWSDTEKCALFSLSLQIIIQIEAHLSDPGLYPCTNARRKWDR